MCWASLLQSFSGNCRTKGVTACLGLFNTQGCIKNIWCSSAGWMPSRNLPISCEGLMQLVWLVLVISLDMISPLSFSLQGVLGVLHDKLHYFKLGVNKKCQIRVSAQTPSCALIGECIWVLDKSGWGEFKQAPGTLSCQVCALCACSNCGLVFHVTFLLLYCCHTSSFCLLLVYDSVTSLWVVFLLIFLRATKMVKGSAMIWLPPGGKKFKGFAQ